MIQMIGLIGLTIFLYQIIIALVIREVAGVLKKFHSLKKMALEGR